MSIKEILLLKRLGLGIISFTGAMVVLLAGWILISALQAPPEMVAEMSSNSGVVEEALDHSREPDSVGGVVVVEPTILKADAKVETVTLGCLRDGARQEMTTQAKQLRVKARLCGKSMTTMAHSSLVNRANGFEATLFNLKNGHFTSDYVALAEGTNQLYVQVEDDSGGRTVAEVTILRPGHGPQSPQAVPAASSTRATETHF